MSLQSLLFGLTALLFPEYCIGCRRQGSLWCLDCLRQVARTEDPPFTNVISLLPYHDPHVRKAIRLLKYKNSKPLAKVLGTALADLIPELIGEEALFDGVRQAEPWILLPIPISQERLKTRGYNQAALIGQAVVAALPNQIVKLNLDVLYKRHHTESQVDIKDRKGRLANPKGSFGIRNADQIYKRKVLVLDDVVTTGATIREAMREVKHAGAHRVLGISVAH